MIPSNKHLNIVVTHNDDHTIITSPGWSVTDKAVIHRDGRLVVEDELEGPIATFRVNKPACDFTLNELRDIAEALMESVDSLLQLDFVVARKV